MVFEIEHTKYFRRGYSEIILIHPDYIRFVIDEIPRSKAWVKMQNKILDRIDCFDLIPYKCICSGRNCNNTPTRASIYRDSRGLVYWCDHCDPTSFGAERNYLTIVKTYQDVLNQYKDRYYSNAIIQQMAHRKGLTGRITKVKAEEFLTGKKHPIFEWDCIDAYLMGNLNPHFLKAVTESLA